MALRLNKEMPDGG
ncbi:hypothetical protein SS209_02746 [Salmonella enterica subsp. enterica serovar Senftenberg str. SS209]|nr:hypothetical protein SS209_02746 [Salmonella enterica subsp. enterica serovar Senftenberg str. SS209]